MSTPSSALEPWALREGNSAEAVKMAAFCGTGITVQGTRENSGLRPLLRLVGNGEISIAYPTSLGVRAIEVLNAFPARAPKPVTVGTSHQGTGAQFNIVIDPSTGPERATVRFNISGSNTSPNVITGGEFVFKSEEAITDFVVLHEYGHGLGLCHENKPGVMSGEGVGLETNRAKIVFALHELDNISAMYRLAPATLYPGASTTSSPMAARNSRSKVIVIVD